MEGKSPRPSDRMCAKDLVDFVGGGARAYIHAEVDNWICEFDVC